MELSTLFIHSSAFYTCKAPPKGRGGLMQGQRASGLPCRRLVAQRPGGPAAPAVGGAAVLDFRQVVT
jgi:hypothetical protein